MEERVVNAERSNSEGSVGVFDASSDFILLSKTALACRIIAGNGFGGDTLSGRYASPTLTIISIIKTVRPRITSENQLERFYILCL